MKLFGGLTPDTSICRYPQSQGRGGKATRRPVIVAIPANNEAERIGACLAALVMQRDAMGAPLADGAFSILVFANNCSDETVVLARAWAASSPHPVSVVEETLPAAQANAGWARKRCMDLAADILARSGERDGVILTTDADSCAAPTWVSATLAAFDKGVDAVAGYIDAHPPEIVGLGPTFLRRGRLEDRYLRAVAEIDALCDPRAHDPWPRHRVSSGASLAVTLSAYRAIGGLPPKPVGEDAALTQALEEAGFAVRHAMDVCVSTSCRFDGRAPGGAADTIRHRHEVAEAPCDADLEPALHVLRRAALKGRLRHAFGDAGRCRAMLAGRFVPLSALPALLGAMREVRSFATFWRLVVQASPVLDVPVTLRPSDLPREIERAEVILRRLRARPVRAPSDDRADRFGHAERYESIPA